MSVQHIETEATHETVITLDGHSGRVYDDCGEWAIEIDGQRMVRGGLGAVEIDCGTPGPHTWRRRRDAECELLFALQELSDHV